MRKDMHKVIVTRPRWGSRWLPHPKLRLDPLPDRSHLGMRRASREQTGLIKGFDDHLKPLERFLWKQRGRPWDKVFHEICEALGGRSLVKDHVHEHLDDFIVRRVSVGRDGRFYGQHGWRSPALLEDCRQALYVDPRDGIIKETGKYRRKLGLPEKLRWGRQAPEPDRDRRVLSDKVELRRIGGIWYRVRFAERPDLGPEARVCDLLTRERVWAGRRHAASKQQLSKSELQSHGLGNSD